MTQSVHVKGFGDVTKQDIRNMNAVEIAELTAIVEGNSLDGGVLCDGWREQHHNEQCNSSSLILYTPRVGGTVSALLCNGNDATVLLNMTHSNLISKAVQLQVRTRVVSAMEFRTLLSLKKG